MPRPGPRPYECVRRAWHSDRHQPIRGSIIQQIFRDVTDAHSSTTRKNREWQEKLPRVVLKAEEIMYSKANSEAEYVDPNTLWDRLNDAINTIIRRDESTETGQFLQPCIEAALVLGCVPVRASRSQRHSNTRSYLSPRFQEPAQAAPITPDKTNNHGAFLQTPVPSGNQLSMPRHMMGNQPNSMSLSNRPMAPNSNCIAAQTVPHLQQCFPRPMPSVPIDCSSSLNSSSVYPLYYGSSPNVQSQFGFQSTQSSNRDSIIIGRPVSWPRVHPPCFSSMRNLLPGQILGIAADKDEQVRTEDSHGKDIEPDCDLSLRLGPSDPCTSLGRHLARANNDCGSSSHPQTSKHTEPFAENRELCFFPSHGANDPSGSCCDRLEQQDNNITPRKRKTPGHQQFEHGSTLRWPELQPNQSDGQSRWPGW